MAVPDCRYKVSLRRERTVRVGKQPVLKLADRVMRLLLVFVAMGVCLHRPGVALAASAPTAPRVVHVVVAPCDNLNRGIAPLAIGNGQNPATNLHWGAAYGPEKPFVAKDDIVITRRPDL